MAWLFNSTSESDNLKTARSMVEKLIQENEALKQQIADLQAKAKSAEAASSALAEKDKEIARLRQEKKDSELSFLDASKTKNAQIVGLKKKLRAARDVMDVDEEIKIVLEKLHAARKYVSDDGPSRPLVIAGPSGVGKGTLIDKLMKADPDRFGFSVSHTTRQPRQGEQHGVNYFFVSKDDFERQKPEMVEWAEVHGRLYGTSVQAVKDVLAQGRVCILDIDVQGAESVRRSGLDPCTVFIAPPSMAELERRLRGRGTETEDQVRERLENAAKEMEASQRPGLFDHIVVNDNLEDTLRQLKAIASSL
eukprot:tig00021464_g21717.t1